jgi:hypothetical protein
LYILHLGDLNYYIGSAKGKKDNLGSKIRKHLVKNSKLRIIDLVAAPAFQCFSIFNAVEYFDNREALSSLMNAAILEIQFKSFIKGCLDIPLSHFTRSKGFEIPLSLEISIQELLRGFFSSKIYNFLGTLKPAEPEVLEMLTLLVENGELIEDKSFFKRS